MISWSDLASKNGPNTFSRHCSERLEAVTDPTVSYWVAAGKQIDAVGAVVQHRADGGMRVDDDQHVELLEGLLEVGSARLRVRRMAPEEHRLQRVGLRDVLLGLEHAVGPARQRHARLLHQLLVLEAGEHPVVGHIPDARPVLPGALRQAVVARQRARLDAEVGGALHVVVAAEDVGAAAGDAHVAERQLQDAVGAHVGVADRVLRAAHAPDHGAGLVGGERLGDAAQLRAGHARDRSRSPRASTSSLPRARSPCPRRACG